MKKFLSLFSYLVFAVGFCVAQSSVTSGTVTEVGGVVWAYATVTATLVNPSGQPPINIISGLAVATMKTATANSSGLFSVTVDRNDEIVPSGTSWNYTVCSVAGICTTVNTSVRTSTLTVVIPSPPETSVAGKDVTNVNQVSQLAQPVGPSFGKIAIIGNSIFIYDVTTMSWVSPSPTQAAIIAAMNGATISPASITGSGLINITGTVTGGAAHFTTLVIPGISELSVAEMGSATLTGTLTGSGTFALTGTGASSVGGSFSANNFITSTNCSSSASPAICGSAPSGSFIIPVSATGVTVNTSAIDTASQVFIMQDQSLGSKLGVTCNTTTFAVFVLVSKTPASSFSLATSVTPTTNPFCMSYFIVN